MTVNEVTLGETELLEGLQEHLCSISVSHKWLATSSQDPTGYFLKEWKFKTPEMCRVETLDPEHHLFRCTSTGPHSTVM